MSDEAYPAESLREIAESIARHAGVRAEDAAILADALIYADLSGIGTHGMSRLPIYIERIGRGLIDPTGQPQVVRETTSAAVVDANGCLGQVVGVFAMRKAMQLARRHGVGVVTAKHSQHFGTAGYYCKLAADEGLIGIALTNSEPAMAPWGSYEAYLGTNPIALGCPTGGEFPIVIDLATSHVARGNIIAAAREGKPIPEGWALDEAGNPTTDAEAALAGSVLPLGGVKGYALALLVDILGGVLSGAGFGTGVGSMYKDFTRPANVGHLLGAIDPAAFMPVEDFGTRVATMVDEIHGKPTAPGFDAVRVPGEIEFARRSTRAKEGVPLTAEVVTALRNLADEAGIEWPEPLKEDS